MTPPPPQKKKPLFDFNCNNKKITLRVNKLQVIQFTLTENQAVQFKY